MKAITFIVIATLAAAGCSSPPPPTQPVTERIAVNPHPDYQMVTISKTVKNNEKSNNVNLQEINDELVIKK